MIKGRELHLIRYNNTFFLLSTEDTQQSVEMFQTKKVKEYGGWSKIFLSLLLSDHFSSGSFLLI